MMALPHWISPEVLRSLGLSLLHFLWQGAVLAALAALLLGMCRKAWSRYAVGVLCLVAMLAAPAVTYVCLAQRGDKARSLAFPAITASAWSTNPTPHSQPSSSQPTANFWGQGAYQWLVEVWFLGVFLFSLRTAGGVILMERVRRRETDAARAEIRAVCAELQARLGIRRVVRFCETWRFDAPAVIGWFRPVVLLPFSALTGLSAPQLEAVIVHELAHIRRYDAFVNLFQIAVEALLFYHPAVWWLNKLIREERENCCDDVVVEICGSPLEYARALTLLEESRIAPAFALGANQGSLPARIRRLLGAPTATGGLRSAGLSAGLLLLCVAAAAGHALLGVAHPNPSPSAPQIEPRPYPQPEADFGIQAEPLPLSVAVPQPEPVRPSAGVPQQKTQEPAKTQSVAQESYIDSLKAVGLDNLSVDDLISLKVQGVTADYVREMQSVGLKPNADELVSMKVQRITPDYVKEMHANGVELNVDDLIGLKVQGVTPEYIRQIKELGLETNADSLIGMKVQGITPDYVREVRALGLKVDTDGLIGMKVQNITPDYVKQMQSLGLHPDADELVGMKVQGITPEYVKQLQAAGLKVNADDCISAKVAGVTPEFIEQVRSHGFKDLTMDQLLELKRAGVLEK